jgi:hypothetical protein
MTRTDLKLDFYQNELDYLDQDYESVKEQLRVEQDGPTQNKLKRKIEQIGRDMKEYEKKIDSLKRQAIEDELDELIAILETYDSQLETIVQAYRQTITHWSVPVNSSANTVADIVNELEKIAPGQSSYTAQSEFIAYLVNGTSEPALANALIQWGNKYREGIDWLNLYAAIHAAQQKRLENAQPAILLSITRSDEATTQAQDGELYYQLNAWLVEDIATYQAQKTGYHSLVVTGSPDAQPRILNELLQKISDLLNYFLSEKNRLCEHCVNAPQVHVFLPLELMHLDVDIWQLNPLASRRPEYLGHDHVVVMRCANRYENSYRKRPKWLKLWKRHQGLLQELAENVFVPGHDVDLDELMEVLDTVTSPDDTRIVGLHVTQAPVDTEELCYELLNSGLPLAIWPRQDLTSSAHEAQLSALLSACCLEQLPDNVRLKRHESRLRCNPPTSHIGHHLSLLWDDPHLVPPKSA